MDRTRVRSLIQYALARAAEADDRKDRGLSAIHLVKYVYLADLEHARLHAGQTYTGAAWKFHHFGPWSAEVWKQIEPAAAAIGVEPRIFDGQFGERTIWGLPKPDEELRARLASSIQPQARRGVDLAVREFGRDTTHLLHHVYLTLPMRCARPGQLLDFDTERCMQRQRLLEPEHLASALSVRVKRRRQELRKQLARKAAEKKAARERRCLPGRPPRYDEVFEQGVAFLDSLAGEPPTEGVYQVKVDPSVWEMGDRGESLPP